MLHSGLAALLSRPSTTTPERSRTSTTGRARDGVVKSQCRLSSRRKWLRCSALRSLPPLLEAHRTRKERCSILLAFFPLTQKPFSVRLPIEKVLKLGWKCLFAIQIIEKKRRRITRKDKTTKKKTCGTRATDISASMRMTCLKRGCVAKSASAAETNCILRLDN